MTNPQAPVGERDGEWQSVPKTDQTGEMVVAGMKACIAYMQENQGDYFEESVLCVDIWTAMLAAAPSPPPETRAAEEWISRDDHIAAMEALRAEYMQRLLGAEPRAAGVMTGEQRLRIAMMLAAIGGLILIFWR